MEAFNNGNEFVVELDNKELDEDEKKQLDRQNEQDSSMKKMQGL